MTGDMTDSHMDTPFYANCWDVDDILNSLGKNTFPPQNTDTGIGGETSLGGSEIIGTIH